MEWITKNIDTIMFFMVGGWIGYVISDITSELTKIRRALETLNKDVDFYANQIAEQGIKVDDKTSES